MGAPALRRPVHRFRSSPPGGTRSRGRPTASARSLTGPSLTGRSSTSSRTARARCLGTAAWAATSSG